jgi:hypothetical protein
LVEAEWLPIELSSIHSKIGYWLDHLLPSGYSIGFLRGVEALLRIQLQARFERDWSEENGRIWVCLVEAAK